MYEEETEIHPQAHIHTHTHARRTERIYMQTASRLPLLTIDFCVTLKNLNAAFGGQVEQSLN